MDPITVPYAHVINSDSLDLLLDEVGSEEWTRRPNRLAVLAETPYKGDYSIASYYVLFLDPSNRTLDYIVSAEALYALFDTQFYNEEIHLITPKK